MQKVANKKQMAIALILVVILATVVLSVAITGTTTAEMAYIETYRQCVFNRSSDWVESSDHLLAYDLLEDFDGDPERVDASLIFEMSAVEELDLAFLTFWNDSYSDASYYVEVSLEYDDSACGTFLIFRCGLYLGATLHEDRVFIDAGSVRDRIYMVYTEDGLFFTRFGFYDNVVGDKSEFEMSLDHVILEYSFDSDPCQFFMTYVIGSTSSYYAANVFSVRETVMLFMEVAAPAPKEGYTFTGWYYDEACTRPYKGESISSDVNLYAGWKIKKYTVYFESCYVDPNDSNTAGLYDYTAEVEHGSIATYPLTLPDEVHLAGWYFVDGSKYDNTPVKQDMHLYGRYNCTVTFDVNGGAEEFAPIEVEYGMRIEFPTPTRDKYDFIGWDCPFIPTFDYLTDPITSDMTLVALWQRNVFTVTFYVDNEIWKQIEVKRGATLGVVSDELNVDSTAVVGFENENIATTASAFNDFVVEDDVKVYLSEAQSDNVEDNNVGSDASSNVVIKFFANVKGFFVKNWKILTAGAGAALGVAVVGVAIALILKRR